MLNCFTNLLEIEEITLKFICFINGSYNIIFMFLFFMQQTFTLAMLVTYAKLTWLNATLQQFFSEHFFFAEVVECWQLFRTLLSYIRVAFVYCNEE